MSTVVTTSRMSLSCIEKQYKYAFEELTVRKHVTKQLPLGTLFRYMRSGYEGYLCCKHLRKLWKELSRYIDLHQWMKLKVKSHNEFNECNSLKCFWLCRPLLQTWTMFLVLSAIPEKRKLIYRNYELIKIQQQLPGESK